MENNLIKITDAFRNAYTKPLPLWRILFCSHIDNKKWYENRVKKYLYAK